MNIFNIFANLLNEILFQQIDFMANTKEITFLEVNSELGAGTRGASLGIDAIKIASLNKENKLFKNYSKQTIETHNNFLWEDVANPTARRIKGISQVLSNICDGVYENVIERFPVMLSGDHSCAAGTICGVKKAYPDKRLGVIWIDAHADLHTPYTTPSGNVHGMPVSIALAEDNLESKVNDPGKEAIEAWNDLKLLGIAGPKFNTEDLVFITVRDTEAPEDAFMERKGIKNYQYDEVKEKGVPQVARETLDRLKDCDIIYVSFDVDSIDSKFSVGTGTPVPNGLTPEEAMELNALLVADSRVVCWESVEVNPTLDTVNKMAGFAFDVVEAVVRSVEAR